MGGLSLHKHCSSWVLYYRNPLFLTARRFFCRCCIHWLAGGRSAVLWHSSSWAGPCFSMTLHNCPGLCGFFAKDGQLLFLFFLGQAGTAAQRPFVPNLVQMLWACHCLFFLTLSFYCCSLRLFHPSVSPRHAQHLLSHLLFDSWHAERCQPIAVTACYLYFLKTRKTISFHFAPRIFILLCFLFSPSDSKI